MVNPLERGPENGQQEKEQCLQCEGRREVKEFDSKGNPVGMKTCPTCHGSGKKPR